MINYLKNLFKKPETTPVEQTNYKLQLDYQSLMGKTAALEAENVELKAKLDDLHKWINQGGGKKTNT